MGGRASDAPADASTLPPAESASLPELRPLPGASMALAASAAGELYGCTLDLEAGTVAVLRVEAEEQELEVTVLGPGGGPLLITDPAGGSPGPREVRLLAESSGVHRLEVRLRGEPPPGTVLSVVLESVALEDLRPALTVDRLTAAVDRLFARAELERRRQQPEGWRRAVELDLEALGRAEAAELSVAGVPESEGAASRLLRRRAEILDHLGWIYRKNLEEGRAAAGAYRRAAELFGRVGDGGRQARVLNNLGRVCFDLGEMAPAKEAWSRALELARSWRDPFAQAAALNHLALHARYRGEVQEALTYYDGCLQVLEPQGAVLEQGRVYNNRGRLYRVLGETSQALADFERSRALAVEADSAALQAIVLTALAGIHQQAGELERARETLVEALALRRRVGAAKGLGVTLRALGSVEEELGRFHEAREAHQQALTSFRQVESPRDEATALEALGGLAAVEGRGEEAELRYREALDGYRRVGDPYGEIRSLTGLAAAEQGSGRPGAALSYLEEALEGIEAVRGSAPNPALAASYFSGQQEPFDLYVDLLMELHYRDPAAGFDARAFEASERSRGRALLDLLAAGSAARAQSAGGSREQKRLLEERLDLQRRLSLLEEERLRLPSDPDGSTGPRGAVGPRATVERELAEALRRYRAVDGEVRAFAATNTSGRSLTVGEVRRQVLDRETLLLEYHLGRRRSFLWLLSQSRLSTYELPPGRKLEAAAERAYRRLRASRRREARVAAEEALRELGATLLGPVAGELPDELRGQRLLISAEGSLLYLPFGALELAAEGGEPVPLLARHEVVTAPSASALAALRDGRGEGPPAAGVAAVFADPVFASDDPRLADLELEAASGSEAGGFRRLASSRQEALAIRDLAGPETTHLALGFEAVREALLDPSLGRYRILHLATHGVLDGERPEMARLVLSRFDDRGRPRDGLLFAHEIYGLRLPVDLVVLSACDTALGREIRGEGLMGLTQPFLEAGAAGLVVSLWQVDDRATAELMTRFYRHLLVEGAGPAAALRQAQLSIRRERAWRAPYYWAGFVLQGEWRPMEPHGERPEDPRRAGTKPPPVERDLPGQ